MLLSTDEQNELIDLFQQVRLFLRIHELDETERTLTFVIGCALHEMKGAPNPAVLAYKDVADGFDPDTIMASVEHFKELATSVAKRKLQ